ncbi:MAG: hypothetical protein NZ527_00150, partial [Hydrogenobacter thermophilus]|nr:hypothetical protein [Hydrogenobacter thermophilus]
MRRVMVVFLLTAFAFGLDFHQVNVKVEMGKLIVDGKVYTLTGDLVVENQRGEPLTLDSLQYA